MIIFGYESRGYVLRGGKKMYKMVDREKEVLISYLHGF